MKNWGEVVAFACALPEVEMISFYGVPCPKLNGKALASPSREEDSFCLFVSVSEKEMLMETDPDTFWETAHYRNYPAVLVRYGTADPERVAALLERAWERRASKAQRTERAEKLG